MKTYRANAGFLASQCHFRVLVHLAAKIPAIVARTTA